ncbi:lysophospholipase [Mycena maculata]|uniref:Lysophospholipase n=1 Tax=Mycena maculata TaxID=230809 RepID=A0AAD7JJS2_9AGAR|nr:lysophospholipase [Mycena maculata]
MIRTPSRVALLGTMFRSLTVIILLVLSESSIAAFGPSFQRCPADFQLVRRGQTVSASEAQYIEQKRKKVLPAAFQAYLKSVKSTGVTLPEYVETILECGDQLPTVGITTSGGGYRAALFGAGVLNALDARNSSSVKKGTGGLLQAATHLAGLSGGGWLVTSLAQANLPTIQDLVFGAGNFGGWIPDFDFFDASSNTTVQATYAEELLQEIAVKAQHFPVSVGDVWGRALARHFSNGTTLATFFANTSQGGGLLFSDLVNLPTFASHEHPFPIMVTDLDSKHITGPIFPGGNFIPLNTPLFEINLFEFGSYDDVLAAHTPLQNLGTTNNSVCVTGFDEAMYLAGTTSNLWNEFNVSDAILAESTTDFSVLVNETYPQSPALRLDTSNFPNPFHGVAPDTFADSHETILALCDGGEDGQISPLQPMLVKDRNIDVIITIDATNDANGFAEGASLIATQERMQQFFQGGLATFPTVPSNLTVFIAEGLATRPTFFGCTPTTAGPLLVYIANGAPPRDGAAPLTNTTTTQTIYTAPEMQGMLDQTFVVATQGAEVDGALEDREWGACLACAVVDRARARQGVERSGVCETCFSRYCWEG